MPLLFTAGGVQRERAPGEEAVHGRSVSPTLIRDTSLVISPGSFGLFQIAVTAEDPRLSVVERYPH